MNHYVSGTGEEGAKRVRNGSVDLHCVGAALIVVYGGNLSMRFLGRFFRMIY